MKQVSLFSAMAKMKIPRLAFLFATLAAALWASEDEAGKRLDAYTAQVARNYPGFYFGDKEFRQVFYTTSDDIMAFEVTLFSKVNYVVVAASDSDIENVDLEGQYGFDPPAGVNEKDNLFPFYISFVKKNQYTFTVPVTGTYRFLFRLQPRRDNTASSAYLGWLVGYELPKK